MKIGKEQENLIGNRMLLNKIIYFSILAFVSLCAMISVVRLCTSIDFDTTSDSIFEFDLHLLTSLVASSSALSCLFIIGLCYRYFHEMNLTRAINV